jgi:hypothetical protein
MHQHVYKKVKRLKREKFIIFCTNLCTIPFQCVIEYLKHIKLVGVSDGKLNMFDQYMFS